jgi:hypothetical protein
MLLIELDEPVLANGWFDVCLHIGPVGTVR